MNRYLKLEYKTPKTDSGLVTWNYSRSGYAVSMTTSQSNHN